MLERTGRLLGPGPLRYWRLPTVFWFGASDSALHTVCWSGIVLGMGLFFGVLPGLCVVLLWLGYLSLVVVGQVFLGYQWDSLLLEAGLLAITQLKGRHNMAAPLDVWQAAYAWMASQSGLRRLPPRIPPDRHLDDDAWTQLMGPYRRRTGAAPWLATSASQAVFDAFNAQMSDLARRGGVSSWLFT